MPNMGVYKKPKGAKLIALGFRVTEGQRAAIWAAAKKVGLCPSDYIRITVFKELAK